MPTRYGLEDVQFEPWLGGGQFPAPDQTGPEARPASSTVDTRVFFPGSKVAGRGVDHPPLSGAVLKGWSYTTPSVLPLWRVLGGPHLLEHIDTGICCCEIMFIYFLPTKLNIYCS
jgi:hypothetical protein